MTENKTELTDSEELFCQEYLIDLNQTQAYIRAYNSDNYDSARQLAYRLFTKVHVCARIKELMDMRANRMEITQDWVILNLRQTYDRCMQAEPVMEWDYETKSMVKTGEYQFDSSGANKSMELIGKHLGMFNPKLDKDSPLPTGGLTPEQFASLLHVAANGTTPSSQG